jgi:hypothetical protein
VTESARLYSEAEALQAFAGEEGIKAERIGKLKADLERLSLSSATGGAAMLGAALNRDRIESYFRAAAAPAVGGRTIPEGVAAAELRENVMILEASLAELGSKRAQRGRAAEVAAEALDTRRVFHERNQYVASIAAGLLRSRAERVAVADARGRSLGAVEPSITGSGALKEIAKRLPDMTRIRPGASDKEIERALDRLLRSQK